MLRKETTAFARVNQLFRAKAREMRQKRGRNDAVFLTAGRINLRFGCCLLPGDTIWRSAGNAGDCHAIAQDVEHSSGKRWTMLITKKSDCLFSGAPSVVAWFPGGETALFQ